MRVLQVISSPSGGGAELISQQIAKGVFSDDFETEIVYFNAADLTGEFKYISLNISPRNILAVFKLRRIFKERLLSNHKLIVHAHLTWPLYYVALASLGLDVKLIYTEHSTYNMRRKIFFLKKIERAIYNRYSKIYCISSGVYDSLAQWLDPFEQDKLEIIKNGGRLFSFLERKNINSEDRVKLISVGSLKNLKGFHTTIKALSLLSKKYRYTIVGEGPEYKSLQKLIGDLDLEGKVELVGWSSDVEQYYHSADIQLIPSKWEGFGLVAVEGMSTGLPVIASNVAGLKEVTNSQLNSVYLVDKFESPQKWAEAIEDMASLLPEKSREWAVLSKDQSKRFGLNKMIKAYKKAYIDVFSK